jgi:hypothetical protein
MLYEYQFQYNVKPVSQLEVCCKIEGVDPLYIRSIIVSTIFKEMYVKGWNK